MNNSGEGNGDGLFDRVADVVSRHVARAWFFTASAMIVLAWLVQGVVVSSTKGVGYFLDPTFQLEINSTTTIITYLLVALLQNTQDRSTRAEQRKLDALLRGLADVLDNTDDADAAGDLAVELRAMAGVEAVSQD